MNQQNLNPEEKKAYTSPELAVWGSVVDLTQTGNTNGGFDAKGGSVLSRGR